MATVVAARRGDPAAFARIVEHWDEHLRPFVHHALGGDGSTDRVLAAAYVRAYRALPRYKGELTPGLWLHRIAYLSATDELRRLSRDRARRRRRAEELMADAGRADDHDGTGDAADDHGDPDVWSTDHEPADHDADPNRIVARPIPVVDDHPDDGGGEPDDPIDPDDGAPPGWHGLAADQRALAVLVDVEGFTAEAAADAFDTTPRVVLDRLGSARRVLARVGARDVSGPAGGADPAAATDPSTDSAGTGRLAVAIVEAPAPSPVALDRGRPGQVGAAAIPRPATGAADAAAGPGGDAGAPEPPEWTTIPGDEIEEVRLVAPASVDPGTDPATDDDAAEAVPPSPDGHELRRAAEEGLGGAEDLTVELVAASRAVLLDLPVPPPGDRFWADLGRRLLAEREAPAAPAIDPMARLARAHPAEPGFHPRAPKGRFRRRPPAPDAASPAVTSLADQADWVRPRRRWTRVLGVLALVAIVAGLVFVAVRIGTSDRIPDGTTAGPDLADDVAAALGEGPYTQVDVAVDEPTAGAGASTGEPTTRRVRVVFASDGSWLVSSLERIDQTTYDAAGGTQRSVAVVGEGDGQTVEASETSGLAAGSPDAGPTPPDVLADLQAVVPLLRSAGDTRATAARSGARGTWTLVRTVPTGPGGADERWRIVIGRDDDLPLVVERRGADGLVRRTRWSGWQLRQTVPADTFAQPLPEGAALTSRSEHFSTTDLAAVPPLGSGPAVTAGWLPPGFELTSVTVRTDPPPGASSTAGGRNPPDREVVSLGFHRGPLRITVTTRSAGADVAAWRDPFERGPRAALDPAERTLTDGRFNGLRVTIASDAEGRAHLWGVTDPETAPDGGTVLTVAGDLTPAQAFRVAASLR